MLVENQFSSDNDQEAFHLSFEAKRKGFSHCLFDYVIGFCYLYGRGGVSQNTREAGKYFRASAEKRDANGLYLVDKYADESRAILAEDFVIKNNQFGVIDLQKAIEYCETLINHNYSTDDALLYLTFIYSQPEYGLIDIDTAIKYCDQLLQSNNPDCYSMEYTILYYWIPDQ